MVSIVLGVRGPVNRQIFISNNHFGRQKYEIRHHCKINQRCINYSLDCDTSSSGHQERGHCKQLTISRAVMKSRCAILVQMTCGYHLVSTFYVVTPILSIFLEHTHTDPETRESSQFSHSHTCM